ncbi:hypothetical protein P3X46_011337 [Hevea brasiliensis]|uniref:Legume lectin domain-containing protein n=2 Tax=Hevea brasiliensis TaxID=3981 RepID=A0ABQ9MJB2_HEVBR|nr:hypothetical protein P3X46_011337 [Hevea brasiliensis]
MLSAHSNYSYSFQSFDKNSNFEITIALYGYVNAVNNVAALQLTRSMSYSAGKIMYKKPIKHVEGKPANFVYFSTHFSFLMSPDNGDGFFFFFTMVSNASNASSFDNSILFGLYLRSKDNNSEIIAVEFETKRDVDLNDNNMGGSTSAKMKNDLSVNMVLNDGRRLSSWIDYELSSWIDYELASKRLDL